MTSYTRAQIRENRETWGNYLLTEGLVKAEGIMGDVETGGRCCLGHAAERFGLEQEIYYRNKANPILSFDGDPYEASETLQNMLGLRDSLGSGYFMIKGRMFNSLAEANDEGADYSVSQKSIGEYILTVIEGGDGTPFNALGDYAV